jgi:hypothetical protein
MADYKAHATDNGEDRARLRIGTKPQTDRVCFGKICGVARILNRDSRVNVGPMDAEDRNRPDKPADARPRNMFDDLRGRNERRASRVRLLEARRAQIERVMEAARQRRFRKGG